jgi:hypothetical protein
VGTPGIEIRTPWQTPEIWLRRTLDLKAPLANHRLVALTYHDEDVEVFLNGVPAATVASFDVRYVPLAVRAEAAKALHPGANIIAVHCRQTSGGQGVDVELLDAGALPAAPPETGVAFSLLGSQTPEQASGRNWSDSYLALTNASVGLNGAGYLAGHPDPLVNWLCVQSVPEMIPPYHAGSGVSRLITMLEGGHHEVRLSREELDKLSCWIDLLVPYCGDYTEANCWTEGELAKQRHYLEKREREAQEEEMAARRVVP